MAGTILKLGYTNPLTDAFGAHPVLGSVLDLNDGLTFTLASPDGLEMPSPPRTLVLAGNIRSQGENATRSITRHNREVTARLFLGPAASSAALLASLRTLLMWLATPPQIPITLQYQPFNGTAPMYLDVVGAAHNLPSDEGQWLRGQFEVVTVTFTCRPGMRGDRVILSNLAPNPGFEQPGSRAVPVFFDTFANANQYISKVGSAPTVGAVNANYPDTVMVDAPLSYYRLNEASGTTAADSSGFGQTATLVSGPTLGVTSPIFGDTNDKAMTFNGTTQRASVPIGSGASALPTGNGVWSVECWFKIAANPAANVILAGFGTYGTTKAAPGIAMNSSGGIFGTTFSGDTAATSAVTLNVWHHAVASWDGSTLRIYLDGAVGPTATPGALSIGTHGAGFGASESGAAFFPGSLDEVAFYGATLSSAHILAHYNAGNAGTGMGTTSNVLTVPSSARVAFGSPVWGSLNLWQIRFRYTSGGTFRFYLHFADGNNFLRVSIGSTMVITHVIAGVNTALAITSSLQLAPNVWYWLQVTQFPAMPNEVADVQATLLSDGNPVGGGPGTPGAQVAMLGPVPTQDALTALCGQPQLEASGAALLVGGPYANVHTVALFGPGGWLLAASGGQRGAGPGRIASRAASMALARLPQRIRTLGGQSVALGRPE